MVVTEQQEREQKLASASSSFCIKFAVIPRSHPDSMGEGGAPPKGVDGAGTRGREKLGPLILPGLPSDHSYSCPLHVQNMCIPVLGHPASRPVSGLKSRIL